MSVTVKWYLPWIRKIFILAMDKEDLMRNGQLKPGYNVQVAVNSEYITGIDVFSDRTDFGTLVPFLKTLQRQHGKKYDSVTADAGYERLGNYLYLEANGQMSFIKPANYEQRKSAKFRKQPAAEDHVRKRRANGGCRGITTTPLSST